METSPTPKVQVQSIKFAPLVSCGELMRVAKSRGLWLEPVGTIGTDDYSLGDCEDVALRKSI